MIRGHRGEQWARSFHTAPWVSYAEALCWIFYRDVEAIATLDFMASDRDYSEMGSGMVEALLAMEAGPDDWRSAAPELALRDALAGGAVKATGQLFVLLQLSQGTHYARQERRELLPTEWLDFRLCDAPPPFDKATTAYAKALPHGARAAGGFTDIWFNRADLTQAFPGAGANQVVHLASVSRTPSGPGSMSDFIRSPVRLSEARAGIVAEGGEVTKGAMLRALAQMFHDAGGSYTSPTLGGLVSSMKASAGRLGLTLEEMNRRADRGERERAKG